MSTTWDTLLAEVRAEMSRQRQKWGDQLHTPERWCCIIGEEMGEVNKAVVEFEVTDYRKELIEVAASCLSAAYCCDVHGT